ARLVDGRPSGQSRAPSEVDVLEVHEKCAIEKPRLESDLLEHAPGVETGAGGDAEDFFGNLSGLYRTIEPSVDEVAAPINEHTGGVGGFRVVLEKDPRLHHSEPSIARPGRAP